MEEKDNLSTSPEPQSAKESEPAKAAAAKDSSQKKEKKAKKEKKGGDATFAPSAIWRELKKVQWPTFPQLMKSSALVIVFTLLFGAYFFVCELAASALVSWIVSL